MHMQGVQGYHLEVVGKIQVKVALKNIEKHAKSLVTIDWWDCISTHKFSCVS